MTKIKFMSNRLKKNILNLSHFSLRKASTSGCCGIANCAILEAATIIVVITAICICGVSSAEVEDDLQSKSIF